MVSPTSGNFVRDHCLLGSESEEITRADGGARGSWIDIERTASFRRASRIAARGFGLSERCSGTTVRSR